MPNKKVWRRIVDPLKRVLLVLAAAALLVGCAAPGLSPTSTNNPTTQPSAIPATNAAPVFPTSQPSEIAAPTTAAPVISTAGASQPVSFINLKMIDDQNGWGVSSTGQILKTEAGLTAWRDISPK
jgi:photosystem II stability/assembly factor-like uncharacterized protein